MKSEVMIVSPYKSATNFYHLFGLVPYEFMRPQMGPKNFSLKKAQWLQPRKHQLQARH